SDTFRKCIFKSSRYYKSHVFLFHLIELIFRNALLQSKQEWIPDSVCLIQYLPPPVFNSGFYTKHTQTVFGIPVVMICVTAREDKIGSFVALCSALGIKAGKAFFPEYILKVKLQRTTRTRFSSVCYRVGDTDKVVNIRKASRY